MNTIIRTLPQVQQAQADAWVYGLIATGIALMIAIVISFLINWRSDRKDFMTRRICFIVIGLALPLSYWFYNMQVIIPKIQNVGFQNMFKETNLYVLLASIGVYAIVGILLMLVFRTSKLGSILGKKKRLNRYDKTILCPWHWRNWHEVYREFDTPVCYGYV